MGSDSGFYNEGCANLFSMLIFSIHARFEQTPMFSRNVALISYALITLTLTPSSFHLTIGLVNYS